MKHILTGGLFAAAALSQAASMTWNFNDTLGSVESGLLMGTNATAALGAYQFMDDVVAGQSQRVLKLTRDAATNSMNPWLQITNPFGANGGGAKTNQFTFVYDVKIASTGDTFHSFYQTDSTNTSDGDMFWNSQGLGISGDYSDTGNPLRFLGDTWQRVVFTYDVTVPSSAAGSGYNLYIDGVLQNTVQAPSNYVVDGRFGLGVSFFLFNDEDNELKDYTMIDNFTMYDRALSASEVANLGAVPEPASMGLLAIGVAALLRRRKA